MEVRSGRELTARWWAGTGSRSRPAPVWLRGGIVAGVVIAVVVLALLLFSSGAAVPGMPAAVRARVGGSPTVLTLHGSTLALISAPEVQAEAALERRLARLGGVRAVYGPAAWLEGRFAVIRRRVAKHTTTKVSAAANLVRLGASGPPRLSDATLTSTLVYGTGTRPLASLHWLFPSGSSARIFVALNPKVNADRLAPRIRALIGAAGLAGVGATVAG